jgi:hypothetical protein
VLPTPTESIRVEATRPSTPTPRKRGTPLLQCCAWTAILPSCPLAPRSLSTSTVASRALAHRKSPSPSPRATGAQHPYPCAPARPQRCRYPLCGLELEPGRSGDLLRCSCISHTPYATLEPLRGKRCRTGRPKIRTARGFNPLSATNLIISSSTFNFVDLRVNFAGRGCGHHCIASLFCTLPLREPCRNRAVTASLYLATALHFVLLAIPSVSHFPPT